MNNILINDSIFKQSFLQTSVGMAHFNLEGNFLRCNPIFYEMLGYTQVSFTEKNIESIIYDEDRAIYQEQLQQIKSGKLTDFSLTLRYLKKNGEVLWGLFTIALIKENHHSCIFLTLMDVTEKIKPYQELERTQQELELCVQERTYALTKAIIKLDNTLKRKLRIKKKLSEERRNLKSITNNLPALISSLDENLCYVFNNKTFSTWFNIPSDQVGKSIRSVIGNQTFNYLLPYFEMVLTGQKTTCEHTLNCRYGEIYVQTILVPCDVNNTARFHCFMLNISEQKQLQDQYEFEASHDFLTGLPNRRAFMKRLNKSIDYATTQTRLAVMFIDIDGFKQINDQYGHEMGDRTLINVAETLKKACKNNEMVARLAGDEFVILVDDKNLEHDQLVELCTNILNATQHSKFEIPFSVSIGAALIQYSENNQITPSEILAKADFTMYQAKLSGKNQFVIN